jgi:hypothetical protein
VCSRDDLVEDIAERGLLQGIDLLLNRKVKEVQRGNLIVEPDGESESLLCKKSMSI